jgi:putative membrane protein
MTRMNPASQSFALLAAALHVLIFCMESLWFMRPAVHRRFGAATTADAEARRLFAFNQGFYNLFLAVGVLAGLGALHAGGNPAVGQTLVLSGCASMFAAGVVLFLSAGRRMLRPATMQGAFPLLAWLFWLGSQ